jgi:hypothetical protein
LSSTINFVCYIEFDAEIPLKIEFIFIHANFSFCFWFPHLTGLVGAPACGDVMQLQLRVGSDGKTIEEAVFKTFGCGSAIASRYKLYSDESYVFC